MYKEIIELFNNNFIARIILDSFLVFILVYLILRFVLRNKKALIILFSSVFFMLAVFVSTKLNLDISSKIYNYLISIYALGVIMILAPEIRKAVDVSGKDLKAEVIASNDNTKLQIADATMFLSAHKIGAIITIEKHKSLDQYADKAITLNSDVSKELLINIFTPMTPLHDGAVIIRGNKIRCAGAYYILTHQDDLEKTTGSRHRAGIGISEVTDSLTVIVSEETGTVSIAVEGIMFKIYDKQKLLEYLDMFLK